MKAARKKKRKGAPVPVFVSYAHKKPRVCAEFMAHVCPLERAGILDVWVDARIDQSSPWDRDIRNKLHKARIVVLLVNIEFIQSDYCNTVEVTEAMKRAREGKTLILPIIVGHCRWELEPWAKFNAFHNDKLLCSESRTRRDKAWKEAVQKLERIALKKKP